MSPEYSSYAVLEKAEANELFELIEYRGLDPWDFRLEQRPLDGEESADVVRYRHHDEFRFAVLPGPQGKGFRLVLKTHHYEEAIEAATDWFGVITQFKMWTEHVRMWRDEMMKPDLWAELERSASNARPLYTLVDDNTLFSDGEREIVKTTLASVNEMLEREVTDPASWRTVQARLSHLEAASERIGRKDWQMMLIGGIVTIGLEAALPPSSVSQLLRFVFHALAGILSGNPGHLPSG